MGDTVSNGHLVELDHVRKSFGENLVLNDITLAIDRGESVETSMGFTPLEGLVMGTRSGDIDPAIVDYVASKEGLSLAEVENLLNKQSGLLGISGLTNDMRELLAEAEEHDDRRAKLAIDIFCHRAQKYVGAYLAAMNGADALLFAGGIGENAATIRARICEGLRWFGVLLDQARNAATVGGAAGLTYTGTSMLPLGDSTRTISPSCTPMSSAVFGLSSTQVVQTAVVIGSGNPCSQGRLADSPYSHELVANGSK
jgi:hypothetical protein